MAPLASPTDNNALESWNGELKKSYTNYNRKTVSDFLEQSVEWVAKESRSHTHYWPLDALYLTADTLPHVRQRIHNVYHTAQQVRVQRRLPLVRT
ncbi:MAG TPA: hypothetical protein VEC57_19390 [Candidatus Limnocylindrales bacterium]|nr:hypothetical protein [Candidatus Limnocylindrales bacterium]